MTKSDLVLNPFTSDQRARFALAYESTAAAYALALSEAAGGLTIVENDFLLALFPYPHSINGVFKPRFSLDNCDKRIEVILDITRQQRQKIRFRLGPAPEPADLVERLLKYGFRKSATAKYMALPIEAGSSIMESPETRKELAGLRIFPINDYKILYQTNHSVLGVINSPKKRCLLRAYQKLAEEKPRRHWIFVAEMEGQLVATVGLFIYEGTIAGFDLTVLRDYRRKGIGTAILRKLGRFAWEQGASLAVLASSIQGTHFYPQLGITHIGGYPYYVYEP